MYQIPSHVYRLNIQFLFLYDLKKIVTVLCHGVVVILWTEWFSCDNLSSI
jgi:hypothetical protein